MPIYATEVSPSYHHSFLGVFINENHYSFELIAKFAFDFFIVFRGVIIIGKILATLTNEGIKHRFILSLSGIE